MSDGTTPDLPAIARRLRTHATTLATPGLAPDWIVAIAQDLVLVADSLDGGPAAPQAAAPDTAYLQQLWEQSYGEVLSPRGVQVLLDALNQDEDAASAAIIYVGSRIQSGKQDRPRSLMAYTIATGKQIARDRQARLHAPTANLPGSLARTQDQPAQAGNAYGTWAGMQFIRDED